MSHIAIITTSYPEENSGQAAAGSFVEDFARELANHVQVSVVAPALSSRTVCDSLLTVQRFTVPRLPLSLLSPAKPKDWLVIVKTLHAGQKAVDQLCAQHNISHLLAFWALPSGHWARAAGTRHNICYSAWALGSDIWSLGKIPVIKGLLKSVLRDAHRCFADGYHLKQDVEQLAERECYFLPSVRKLSVIGGRTLRQQPPYRLAFLGRWHPNKGVDLLLRGLQLLNDEDWNKIEEVRIYGGGPLERTVYDGSAALHSEGRRVCIGGYLDKAEAADLLSWADYMLLPSRIESIPVIFSDAMQANCPVISTPIGDMPTLLEQYKVGICAKAVSSEEFAAALRIALEFSPQYYSSGLQQARRYFNVGASVRGFLQQTG